MRHLLLFCFMAACLTGSAQLPRIPIAILDSGRNCSIRGMSIPANNVIWVSGSNGHVGRSTDGGRTWGWMVVAGHEQTDFRDIHAFDSLSAIIMGIGDPAYILKTRDGGRSWNVAYTRTAPGMFLDAMDFRNDREGICIGDPIDDGDGRRTFFVVRTADGGETWKEEPSAQLPQAGEGEAVFAASGTNIALLYNRDFDYAFVSGGRSSNFYLIGRNGKPNKRYPLRIVQGKESSGAFSMATDGRKKFYCTGGDYKEPEAKSDNFVWTANEGKSWAAHDRARAYGYRSCIRIIDGQELVACGTNGVDLWRDAYACEHISDEGFNVCMVSPDRRLICFGGGRGKIGVLRR